MDENEVNGINEEINDIGSTGIGSIEKDSGSAPTEKNWMTALLLCWFLGFLGVHRLYAGKLGSGALIAYCTVVAGLSLAVEPLMGATLFTFVGAMVVYDFLLICTKNFKDCYGRDIVREK